MKIDISK